MTLPTKNPNGASDIMESVIAKGDLAKLSPDERVQYYNAVCKSLGLNPFTKPFDYHNLNGRLILYANRSAADQLRKLHGITISIVSQEFSSDILTIHVKARDKEGREDEDLGVVPFSNQLKGEARANQIMKAVTKAKRRVTLSISGLGWLDETEVEDIPRNVGPGTADEYTEVPAADDPDRIPTPKDPVTELPRMQQREPADRLGKELAACKTMAEVEYWKNLESTSHRVWQLRELWRETLQGRVKEKLMELRGAAEMAALQHEQDAALAHQREHDDDDAR